MDAVLKELLDNKKYDEMDKFFKKTPVDKKTPYQFIAHSEYLFLINEKEKSYSIMENAISTYHDVLNIRVHYAELAMKCHDWGFAIKCWQYIIDNFSSFPQGVFWRQANAFLFNGDFKKAEDIALLMSHKSINQKQKAEDFIFLVESKKAQNYEVVSSKYKSTLEFFFDSVNHQPTIGKFDLLKSYRIRGWVGIPPEDEVFLVIKTREKIKKYVLNESRPSVANHLHKKGKVVIEQCGFNYTVDIVDGIEIGFLVNNEEFWVSNIQVNILLGTLRGKDDWLFLTNDKNKSTEQFTGKLLLTEKNKALWRQFTQRLSAYQGHNNLLYVLANAKEKVYTEKYPFDMGKITVTEQVEEILLEQHINYLNPVNFLKGKIGTYYKTDTHWSDYGAYITFQQMMVKTGHESVALDFIDSKKGVIGDLGSKVAPPENSVRKVLSTDLGLQNEVTFYNGLRGTGMISILVNKKAIYKKTVLMFGGSSMTVGSMDKYLSVTFERVIKINLPGALVDEIIQKENPDLLLMLTNERYLISPGKIHEKFHESQLSKKLSSLSKEAKETVLRTVDKFNGESFYKNLTIDALNIKL